MKGFWKFTLLIAVMMMATAGWAATIDVPADYTTIQAAIDAAAPGDEIVVATGTYTEPLVVYKSLTITGAGQGSTIIDLSGYAGPTVNGGIYVSADNVTLQQFTLIGNPTYSGLRYGIKTGTPVVSDENINHVTVQNFFRSGIDLLGVNNVLVSDVTSTNDGVHGGNGLQCGDAHGVTFNNITTSGNPWGAIGIMVLGRYVPRGTDDIVISGNNSFGEMTAGGPGIYLESEDWTIGNPPGTISYADNLAANAQVTLLDGTGDNCDYATGGPQDNEDVRPAWRARFYNTLEQCQTVIQLAHPASYHTLDYDRYIRTVAEPENFYVYDYGDPNYMSIQAAIDNATGTTINVAAGVYHERLTLLASGLDLRGAQYGVDPTPGGARINPANESVIDQVGIGDPNPDVLVEIPIGAANASISGFTLHGRPVFLHSDDCGIRCWANGATVQDNIIDGYQGAIFKGGSNFTANRNRIIATKQCVVVQPNPATNVTISNNKLDPSATPAADCQAIYMTATSSCSVTGNTATGFANGGNLNGSDNTQLLVSGNTFTGGKKGVNLWGNTTFVTISGNMISGSVEHGINVKGANITISGNTITGNTLDGIKIDFHVIPTQFVSISGNTISGNGNKALEVTPTVTQTVDADSNYWGTTDYCGLPPLISGLADYDPWCDAGPSNCTFTAATSATVHNVTQNTHFCSLTEALTAAASGDEIHADAGAIFHEHAIPIHLPVTLIGVPGDATPGCGANAPIVDGDNNHFGFEFLDGAHDVIISGFEFRNFGASASTGWGVPVFAWDVNTYNVTINDNYMHDIEGNGVLVGSDYADQHSNWTITRNRLTEYGWTPSADEAYGLELTNCSNGVISNNIIEPGSRIPGMAIRVSGRIADMHNVDVLDNYVRGSFVRCAIQVNAYDFEVSGAHLDDVRIEGNDIEISGAPRVVFLRDDVNGTAILSNVVIYDNKLVSLDNQLCVESLTDLTMDASGNWWGDNTPAGVAAKMAGPVDFGPWLNAGTDLNAGLPFHGDFSVLWVDDDYPQAGALGHIQEAINMVSGSTVYIAPGIYNETPTTAGEHGLTLQGTDPNNRPHITGGLNGQLTDNLTLNDLWVTGDASGAVVRASNTAGTSFTMNHVKVDGENVLSRAGINGNHLNGNVSITYCEINNVNWWVVFDTRPGSGGPCDGSLLGTCVFSNNTLDNNKGHVNFRGTLGNATPSVTISNNTVTNVGTATNSYGSVFKVLYATNCVFQNNSISDVGTSGYNPAGEAPYGSAFMPRGVANLTCTNNTFTNCNQGIAIEPRNSNPVCGADGVLSNGTISDNTFTGGTYGVYIPATLHPSSNMAGLVVGPDNSFVGQTVHTLHNGSALGTITAECNWWGSLDYPTVYSSISGLVDFTPYNNAALNSCTYTANVDFVLADPYIGCACNLDTLFLTCSAIGLPNLEVIVQLPGGFDLDVSGAPPYYGMPTYNADPNLDIVLMPAELGGDQVQVSIDWDGTGSSGGSYYVAAIPIKNTSAGTGAYAISGVSNNWIDVNGNHPNTLTMGATTVNVDCAVPPAPASFANTVACAYGPGNMPADAFAVTDLIAGTFPGDTPISSVWITFNGNAAPTFPITLTGSEPYDFTFPAAGSEASFYGMLDDVEGCNTLNLHVTDEACNSTAYDLINVGWDGTAPVVAVTDNLTLCYNAMTAAAALAANLDIDVSDLSASNCRATTGTLTITSITTPGGTPYTLALTADLADFPGATYYNALWTWMTTSGQGNVPAYADGETYTFNVVANDCAGNVAVAQTFDVCLDLTIPANTVSFFDARPADAAVWLKWEWTASVQADCMVVFRSDMSGLYPANSSGLWDDETNDYLTTYSANPAGWELVAVQTGISGTISSLDYTGLNGHLVNDHAGVDSSYWLDRDASWASGAPSATYRDVYRYVTFVRDNGGNWSTGAVVPHWDFPNGGNADRSTNYWLGDFAASDAGGFGSGHVNSEDVTVLSTYYFTAAGNYTNVGPVVVENGSVGKGIPNPPDAMINFQDFVVLGFNYGMVSPVNSAPTEFLVPHIPNTPTFDQLDSEPVVSLSRTGDVIEVGEVFTVTVSLSGNEENILKGAEVEVTFDPEVLEFVSVTESGLGISGEGVIFTKASLLDNNDAVGMVAGACGGNAMLMGDGNLGTITFKWVAEHAAGARIALRTVKLADGSGDVIEYEGSALTIGADDIMPLEYALHQNYPNPFNPTTHIRFDLPEDANVRLVIFNVMGQEVRTLISGSTPAGIHTIAWDGLSNDGRDVGTGLYIYRITANHFTATQKMLLTR